MQVFQRTLANSVSFSGVGLHTGKKVNVRIEPAPADTGIVFIRTDIKGTPEIKACPENVSNLFFATNLEKDGVSVKTVEHLMAAFSAYGIDNAYVFVDSEEIPILDGSAAPYILLFEEAGVRRQNALRTYARLKSPVSVKIQDKFIKAVPHDRLVIKNVISFNHTYKKVRWQEIVYEHNLENFKNLGKARTFCFVEEVDWLRSQGLALGGSLENAIVIDKYDVLNPGGLRMENEFVAHKTLDLVGDLYILGMPLLAKISAFKTGHALNASFVKKIYFERLYEKVVFKPHEARSGITAPTLGVVRPEGGSS